MMSDHSSQTRALIETCKSSTHKKQNVVIDIFQVWYTCTPSSKVGKAPAMITTRAKPPLNLSTRVGDSFEYGICLTGMTKAMAKNVRLSTKHKAR